MAEEVGFEARQPDSAIRKCIRFNESRKTKYSQPLSFECFQENDDVLVAGFGCKGHAVGDIPGICFKVVKVANVSLLVLYKRVKGKTKIISFDGEIMIVNFHITYPKRNLSELIIEK